MICPKCGSYTKKTCQEDPNNTPAKFVELFLFWIDGHEDKKTTQLGCTRLDIRNTIPHVGFTDVDLSMDRCSFHSFGLLKCGCSCVRPPYSQ